MEIFASVNSPNQKSSQDVVIDTSECDTGSSEEAKGVRIEAKRICSDSDQAYSKAVTQAAEGGSRNCVVAVLARIFPFFLRDIKWVRKQQDYLETISRAKLPDNLPKKVFQDAAKADSITTGQSQSSPKRANVDKDPKVNNHNEEVAKSDDRSWLISWVFRNSLSKANGEFTREGKSRPKS